MSDDHRDPELEWVRTRWKAPDPGPSLQASVLAAYRREVVAASRKRWVKWAPIPVAAAAALAVMTFWNTAQPDPYRAVAQPRLIVVSQGELP